VFLDINITKQSKKSEYYKLTGGSCMNTFNVYRTQCQDDHRPSWSQESRQSPHFTSQYYHALSLLERSRANDQNTRKCLFDFLFGVYLKLPSHIPRDLTASLLRPCYDPGRSTVAMDAAGTQRGRSEEPKDAQGRRPSASILNMHKTVAETLHSCLGRRGIAVESP